MSTKENLIPKKIHYCWFGGKELPEEAKKCIASWKKFMPDFEIIRHDESNFDLKPNRYASEAYENKMYAFVSDYARLRIIYDNGGIYFDTDVELVKPLSNEMLKNGFFAKEDKKHINTGLGFAAKKGDKTVKKMLDDYEDIPFILRDGSEDKTSCPIRNTKAVKNDIRKCKGKEFIDKKPVYPRDYFAPLNFNTGLLNMTENTYAIHLGAASWLGDNIKKRIEKRNVLIKRHGKHIGLFIYKTKRLFGIIK
jgi:hypothetical protein